MPERVTSFGILPAAGHSRRMGRPKLLIPLAGAALLEHTVAAWKAGGVDHLALVARRDDTELVALARRLPVDVVLPASDPPDMRASVQSALDYLAQHYRPAGHDAWLLAPADIPDLAPAVIQRLLDRYDPAHPRLLRPRHAGRSGHPLLVPWQWADRVPQLPAGEGVKALLGRCPVEEVDCSDLPEGRDVDTPEALRGLEDRIARRGG